MSRGSSTTTCGARNNYRPCHLEVPRLLTANSPRCHEIENRSYFWPPSARTSISVGEEPLLQSCLGKADPLPTCRSQTSSTYFRKYLERKIILIQEQHQNVVTENTKLNNQLSRAAARNQELEEKAAALEEALLRERHEPKVNPPTAHQNSCSTQGVSATVSSLEASTTTDSPRKFECAVQTTIEKQQKAVECNAGDTRDLVSISKSELASLESDIKTLRDAVRAREELWDQTVEREHSYREHLARLSVELVTLRQLSESRLAELQALNQRLTEKKDELKTTQRELALAKKTIVKLQKRQRVPEECPGSQESTSTVAVGDSLKKQQVKVPDSPVAKLQHKSKVKDTARGSPRHCGSNSPRIDEQ